MNNAKQKAEQLWSKFSNACGSWIEGRTCAIIAVDEILELDVTWVDKEIVDKYSKTYSPDQCKEYWAEVKQRLEEMLYERTTKSTIHSKQSNCGVHTRG